MDMFGASHSRLREAALTCLNSGAGAFGARATVVNAIILDGEAANMAIPAHTRSDIHDVGD